MALRVEVIERWYVGSKDPCEQCSALAGQEWPQGKGPRPVVDTHAGCACERRPSCICHPKPSQLAEK